MTMQELIELSAGILGAAAGDLTLESRRGEVAGWDSMQHLTLVMALEQATGVSIAFDDVVGVESLGELLALCGEKEAVAR